MGILKQSQAKKVQFASDRTRYINHTDNLMLTVFDFFNGPWAQPDPPHSHPHDQVTYVAEGEVRFFLDGVPTELKAGDTIAIPGGVLHTIQILTPHLRMVDSFTPLRQEFLEK